MGVLILDMKFPKTCAACEWSRYSFPNAWCGRTHKTTDIEIAKNGRPDDCPLAHVQPHGRLIDADALIKVFKTKAKNPLNQETTPYSWAFAYECLADVVADMPTIIPAEEGE